MRELAFHGKIQSTSGILSTKVGIQERQWRANVKQSVHIQKLLCARELGVPMFKLALRNTVTYEKRLTLTCRDHTSVLPSAKLTIKASGHFQVAWHLLSRFQLHVQAIFLIVVHNRYCSSST